MNYPLLQNYLQQLQHDFGHSQLNADTDGRVVGRFYQASLSSVFDAVRQFDDKRIVAYEAHTRGHSGAQGVLVERLLEHAATDDESIELDRLSRLIHTLNFFRQEPDADTVLILNVHKRLLAAVESGHGRAFLRILQILGVPQQQVVLQLPPIVASQTWVLNHVAESYQRHGFRVSLQSSSLSQARALLRQLQPAVLHLPAYALAQAEPGEVEELLAQSQQLALQIVVDVGHDSSSWRKLEARLSASANVLVKGQIWDSQSSELLDFRNTRAWRAVA